MAPTFIHHLSTVDSTQDEAARHLRGGAPSGFTVLADVQTKGRGRQGRGWESEKGNLFATVIWEIPTPQAAMDYSLLVAIALHSAVAHFLDDPTILRIKWPNDLLLNGVKCAGILVDRPDPTILLIGTGVNITNAPTERTCLSRVTRTVPSPRDLVDVYLQNLEKWDAVYRREGLRPIRAAWLDRAYGIGENMVIRLPNETFPARFDGLAEDGACLARLSDGTVRPIHTGEVFF